MEKERAPTTIVLAKLIVSMETFCDYRCCSGTLFTFTTSSSCWHFSRLTLWAVPVSLFLFVIVERNILFYFFWSWAAVKEFVFQPNHKLCPRFHILSITEAARQERKKRDGGKDPSGRKPQSNWKLWFRVCKSSIQEGSTCLLIHQTTKISCCLVAVGNLFSFPCPKHTIVRVDHKNQ